MRIVVVLVYEDCLGLSLWQLLLFGYFFVFLGVLSGIYAKLHGYFNRKD
jgi:hypothetical protein